MEYTKETDSSGISALATTSKKLGQVLFEVLQAAIKLLPG